MFYNTTQETYIWILSNHKEERRKGKIQLINATQMKTSLRRNMGKKNCEISKEQQKTIVKCFMDMEENEYSQVLSNSEFGYWKITILHPKRNEDGSLATDKKGKMVPDKSLTETEIVPFNYAGGINGFLEHEILCYAPDSWINTAVTKIGYDLSFEKYFHTSVADRSNQEILTELTALQNETQSLLSEILGGAINDN